MTQQDSQGTDNSRLERRLLWLVITSFALLGTCVGFFAGMSESPVTATVIPLLFALLGGGAGFAMLRTDLTSTVERSRLRLAASGIAAFAGFCMLGAIYGVNVRSGVGLTSFLPRFNSPNAGPVELPIVRGESFELTATTLLLRSRLELLGASNQEIATILRQYAAGLNRRLHGPELRNVMVRIRDAADEVHRQVSSFAEKQDAARMNDDRLEIIRDLSVAMSSLVTTLNTLIAQHEAGVAVTSGMIRSVSKQLEGAAERFLDFDSKDAAVALQGSGVSVERIKSIHERLKGLADLLAYRDQFSDLREDIDAVIQMRSVPVEMPAAAPTLTRRPGIKR